MNPVSVYVVDDQAMVCDAIQAYLEGDPDIQVLGTETDPLVAMDHMVELNPNVVLLDLKMPVCSGRDVLVRSKPHLPDTHFLVLSGEASNDQGVELVCAGASGLLLKTVQLDTLRKAVKCVAAGELWLGRGDMAEVVRLLASPNRAEWDTLSHKELEVVQAVVDGLSNREIGKRLSISEETVKSHLKTLFRRLRLVHRAELAGLALAHGVNRR